MEKLNGIILNWLETATGHKDKLSTLLQSQMVIDVFEGKFTSLDEFLQAIFVSCTCERNSSEISAILFLIYVSYSNDGKCSSLRDILCSLNLDMQLIIHQFLKKLSQYQNDLGGITLRVLRKATENLDDVKEESSITNCKTPNLNVASPEGASSPMQTFFQNTPHVTPKRRSCAKKNKWKCQLCSGGERLKQLHIQLEEEYNEKMGIIKNEENFQAVVAALEQKLDVEKTKSANLSSNCAALEAELASKAEIMESVQNENADLNRKIKILFEDHKYQKECSAELTQQNEELQCINDEVMAEIRLLRDELQRTAAALASSKNEVNELSTICDESRKMIRELEGMIEGNKTGRSSLDDSALYHSVYDTGENLGDQLLADARQEIENLTCLVSKLTEDNKAIMAKYNVTANMVQTMKLSFEDMRQEVKSCITTTGAFISESAQTSQQLVVQKMLALDRLNIKLQSHLKAEKEFSKAEIEKWQEEAEALREENNTSQVLVLHLKQLISEEKDRNECLITNFENKTGMLEKKILELSQSNINKSEEISSLSESLLNEQTTRMSLEESELNQKQTIVNCEENIERVSQELENVKLRLRAKTTERDEYYESLMSSQSTILSLTEERVKIETNHANLVEKMEDSLRQCKKQLKDLKSQLNTAIRKRDEHFATVKSQKSEIGHLKGENKKLTECLTKEQMAVTEAKETITKYQQNISEVAEIMKSVGSQICNEFVAADSNIVKLAKTLVDVVTSERANMKSGLDALMEQKKKIITQQVSKMEALMDERDSLKTLLDQEIAMRTDVKAKLDEETSKRTDLDATVLRLEDELMHHQQKIKNKSSETKKLTNELNVLQEILAEKNEALEKGKQQFKTAKEDADNFSAALDQERILRKEVAKKMENLQNNLECTQQLLEEKQLTIQNLKSENDTLLNNNLEKDKIMAEQCSDNNSTKTAVTSLKDELAEERSSKQKLETLVAEIKDQISGYDINLAEKESQLAQLKDIQDYSNRKLDELSLALNLAKADICKKDAIIYELENEKSEINDELSSVIIKKEEEMKQYIQENLDANNKAADLQFDLERIYDENKDFCIEIDHLRSDLHKKQTHIDGLESEVKEGLRRIEQQAVEFSREKMRLTTELEQHQVESAKALRDLEAKNHILDKMEVDALKKTELLDKTVHELNNEIMHLTTLSNAEPTVLSVNQSDGSEQKKLCSTLTQVLTNLTDVVSMVQRLRVQQESNVRQLKNKEETIQQLKRECESRERAASSQLDGMKHLLGTVGKYPSQSESSLSSNSSSSDTSDTFASILNQFHDELNSRAAKENEMRTELSQYRHETNNLKKEKNVLDNTLNNLKLKYWVGEKVCKGLVMLNKMRNYRDFNEEVIALFEESPQEMDSLEFGEITKANDNVNTVKNVLMKLMKWIVEMHGVVQAKEALLIKSGEDYKALEQRTCSLAQVNARLSTENLKFKNSSSTELELRDTELTSLKTTVSGLNAKILQLTSSQREIVERNSRLSNDLVALQQAQQSLVSAYQNDCRAQRLLLEVIQANEEINKYLVSLRSQVPEMLTVISALEQRRLVLADDIIMAVREGIRQSERVLRDATQTEKEDRDLLDLADKLSAILKSLREILDNISLIEAKTSEELSDSLEEVAVPDRTFPIINLSEDTFCMPPHVDDVTASARKASWQISPPKKNHISTKPVSVKSERKPRGDSWVVPAGPAPSKPARQSQPRARNDSTSSNCSTKSLPAVTAPSRDRPTPAIDPDIVRQLRKENQALKAKVNEEKEERLKEQNDYESGRLSIRSKYEKQLEIMKAQMKNLYNEEMKKVKAEQSKITNEVKKENDQLKKLIDDLRRENSRLTMHVDEMNNQYWTISDKLLREQNRDRDVADLSRQLDKLTLKSSEDTWSIKKENEKTVTDGESNSKGHVLFPPMPVEDEEEVFDNRYLEEIKSGKENVVQSAQARLTELKMRNSMCPPHLKSSYPGETQFVSPNVVSEHSLRASILPFGCESGISTDSSDPSMTRSLIPPEKSKKKDQTSYKRPGPPTPSKNGRPSLSGDIRLTPKPLREQNVQEKPRGGTPSRLKALFRGAGGGAAKRESLGFQDENSAPSTPKSKGLRIFQRKPFGGRDF